MCAAEGQLCHRFAENPAGGSVSFDNVAMAMLPVLQAITFDTCARTTAARKAARANALPASEGPHHGPNSPLRAAVRKKLRCV